jgi:hypothetical protein
LISVQDHFRNVEGLRDFSWCKHLISQLNIPSGLPTWVFHVLLQPVIVDRNGYQVSFAFSKRFRSRAQVRPPRLDFS